MMQLILTIPILTATTRLLKTCPTLFLCMVDAIGSTHSPYVRTMYGERWMYPIIQVFVVAPPASGKGVVSWCRNFVEPEHERIRSAYKKEMKAYEKEKRIQEQMGLDACLSMAEPLYLHATHIGSFIDRVEVKNRNDSDRERLLNEMDDKFSRKQWLDVAEDMGVPLNTAATWLNRMVKSGVVVKGEERGTYTKSSYI